MKWKISQQHMASEGDGDMWITHHGTGVGDGFGREVFYIDVAAEFSGAGLAASSNGEFGDGCGFVSGGTIYIDDDFNGHGAAPDAELIR